MNTLTVYRASAGSGKTFTLAVQYIKLLVENPQAYRHTLAVTFTNKATEEMKMRILSQLYGISVGLNESKPYLECVKQLSGLEENTIIANAGYALRELIHHYSYFRVETIDAFFQTVLRNLARELELTANLRIELNDEQVEQQAVDQLISRGMSLHKLNNSVEIFSKTTIKRIVKRLKRSLKIMTFSSNIQVNCALLANTLKNR